MRRRFWIPLLAAMLGVLGASEVAAAEPVTLEQAVRRALDTHPDVRRAEADVEAAQARVEQAALLLQDNPFVEGGVGPRRTPTATQLDLQFGVVQPVQIAGQRGVRIEAEEAGLRAARAQLDAVRTQVVANTREQFAEASAAVRREQIARTHVEFAQRAVVAAKERLEAGQATRIDTNTALIELGRARRELAAAEVRMAQELSGLRWIIGGEPSAQVVPAVPLERFASASSEVMEEPAALDTALAQRADLTAARSALERARALADLAERSVVPDPQLGVAYEREGDEYAVRGVLGLSLPVFDRNQAERGEARAQVRAEQAAVNALERRIREEVSTALRRYRTAAELASFYGTEVKEAARENVLLAQEAYAAGKIGLFELLLAQRAALDAQTGYVDALEELARARAQLGLALGEN